MHPVKVLVVDDSAVFRTTLSKVLESSPLVAQADTAPDGRLALQKIQAKNPDLVILDVEMPGMDGIETLREIKKRWPDRKVLMFSAHTQKGAAATIDALALGALDFVAKPSGGSLEDNRRTIEQELLPRISAILGGGSPAGRETAPESRRREKPAVRLFNRDHPPLVAVGVSTGGPTALSELLPLFPASFPSSIVITQHMPPVFTKQLATRLDQKCALAVHEAEDGMEIKPGHVYIAPGDFHMEVRKVPGSRIARLHLHQGPPECSCRPSVDVMFRSIADSYGANVIAVILTGMGQDGFLGSRILKGCEAHVIAQNEASCVVYGMPSFIVNEGLADDVLPLEGIGRRILELVRS